jgi:serine/threonine-protein phosphatase PGAM5
MSATLDHVTVVDLYLIRHGEASETDTPAGCVNGPGLSDTGRRQTRALAARLTGRTFAAVLHSPSRRAAETAEILGRALSGVPVRSSDLLTDRTPVPSDARRSDYPERHLAWLDQTAEDEKDRDGLALSEAVDRLSSAALATAAVGPVVLVTHAFVIGWFVRTALDAPTWRWMGLNSANTGVTIIRYGPTGPTLLSFNDTGHLSADRSDRNADRSD